MGKERRRRDERSRSRSPRERLPERDRRKKERSGSFERDEDSASRKKLKREEERIKEKDKYLDNSEGIFDTKLDKEAAQQKLEAEMNKRRDRIERWRAERRERDLKREVFNKKEMLSNLVAGRKAWTLDGDDDDDDEGGPSQIELKKDPTTGKLFIDKSGSAAAIARKAELAAAAAAERNAGEDEEDPLDAYMRGVQAEVRKEVPDTSRPSGQAALAKPKNAVADNVVIVTSGVAKKLEQKNKGELIEQNVDGLEYSSEEEKEDIDTVSSMNVNKQGKKEVKIDHAKIEYAPFRKAFYLEVPELARLTPAEVDAYRCELEGIRIKGKGCPKPIMKWAHAGLSRKEMDVLKKVGFEKPTPIQAQAIPAIMSGRDLIGIAKTGSGKTLGFLLPMFRHIMDQPPLDETDGPIAILMAPTRELCIQIGKDAKRFCKSLGLRVVCVYGGTGISEQIAELKRGAEIIVCTPGRMIDMINANSGRVTNLRRCTYIVLDEADRMFDMGFEPQVMRIIDNIRPDRQTVMFSATFPRQMEALARRILQKPLEVQVGGRSVVCKEVEQIVVVMEEDQKFLKLLELLGNYQEQGSVLVFVEKQENADSLLKDLLKSGYPCLSLHGGIDQYDRDSTIGDFKSGRCKLLIATSVAARGLDVKHLILVINYDCPNHYEDYVHRCGRTGRAGNKGHAYTFVVSENAKYTGEIIRALELSEAEVPSELKELWTSYKAEQEAEGKKIKSGGGFSGTKGYKFDEAESQMATEKKKFQKHVLGLEDSDDEDLEGDLEQQIETMMAPKRTVKEVTTLVSLPVPGAGVPSAVKLELAKKLASKIQLEKNLVTDTKAQLTAEAVMKGNLFSGQPRVSAKNVAEQLANKLNMRLNYQPPEEGTVNPEGSPFSIESTNPMVQTKYEEELEINDFPQQARWKITSKETLAQVGDYSEAGITVRGTYIPPNDKKPPPEGERKLYLAIESMSELSVSKAKNEIVRILKEEMLRIQSSSNHFVGTKGRYKVL